MVQFPQSSIDAAWDKLNPEIREAILSDKIDGLVNSTIGKHNLDGQSENIITLCIYAIHGLLDQKNFFNELTTLVGPAISPALARDLIGSVIIPVLSLKSEEPEAEPSPKAPLSAEPAPAEAPAVQVPTPASSPAPVPAAAPTPFIIHAEAESVVPVKDTRKSLAEPVRPKFYEEERPGEAAVTPSYAKLQFAAPAAPAETSEIKPEFKEEKSPEKPTENNISLKDLPL